LEEDPTKLCLIGDSSSVHLRRWAIHFSKSAEVIVISDSPDEIPGVKVISLFRRGAGIRNLVHVLKLRNIVREFGPDIVHGHYLTVGGLYAALSNGKRIVGSAWGSDIYRGPQRSFMERSILRFVLRRCDLVFAGTKDMMEQVREFGYTGDIAIFRWGVDPDIFKRTAGHGTSEFRITSIRPCSKLYNPLEIVKGFKLALPKLGNAYLYMLDFGNMIEAVHEMVEEDPELVLRVRFLPKKPYGEMPEVYNSSDLAISIPDSDSAAASVLEAMACEVPVIASDIPNMREWIEDGVNGFLTPMSSGMLAEALRRAYATGSKLPGIGRLAREKVLDDASQGTFESSLRVAERSYEKLLGKET
jgi:glycosyltransferase involved in cell wall biosynthesis